MITQFEWNGAKMVNDSEEPSFVRWGPPKRKRPREQKGGAVRWRKKF